MFDALDLTITPEVLTLFSSFERLPFTENHLRQLHGDLLAYSDKDAWHRGAYKTAGSHRLAFDTDGRGVGVSV